MKYTVAHFKDEEALQRIYEYPDYRAHKKTHEDFKATVHAISTKFLKSFSIELFDQLKNTVFSWLKQHVLVDDKKIENYIRGRTPKLKPIKNKV